MRILITLLAAIAITGCRQNPQLPAVISPYRIDIQQGNVVTQEMVGKLKVGLTRSQVRYVLGSPLVVDVFHADRWDYVYLLQRQGKPDERRRLTVLFDGDKLTSLEGDVVLTEKATEPELTAPKPPVTAVAPAPKPAAPITAPVPKPPAVNPIAATPTPAPKPEAPKSPDKPPVAATPALKPEAGVVAPAEWGKPASSGSAAAPAPPAQSAMAETPRTSMPPITAAPAPKADAAKVDPAPNDVRNDPAASGVFGRILERIGF